MDEQESLDGGVTVLVTGSLTGKDTVKDFTQSFFLAPRGTSYFVLNDIFRYVDTNGHQAGNVGLVDGRNKVYFKIIIVSVTCIWSYYVCLLAGIHIFV